jgi:hypothetical protein
MKQTRLRENEKSSHFEQVQHEFDNQIVNGYGRRISHDSIRELLRFKAERAGND